MVQLLADRIYLLLYGSFAPHFCLEVSFTAARKQASPKTKLEEIREGRQLWTNDIEMSVRGVGPITIAGLSTDS